MNYSDFIQSWRKCTHNFDSDSFWNMRLSKLNIFDEDDMNVYWETMRQSSNNTKLQISFGQRNFAIDGKHSFLEHQIAQELCDFTENIIQKSRIPFVFCEQAKNSLKEILLYQLEILIKETLIFEHKVFTTAFPKENSSYAYFINEITYNSEWLEYFTQAYPVLCEDLNTFINNYKAFIVEFLDRLQEDFTEICHKFAFSSSTLKINKLDPFCGDMHRSGRSTISIILSDNLGSTNTFFYKPKSLSPDTVWNTLMKRMWSLGMKHTVVLTTNIDKNNYGWQKGELSDTEVDNCDQLKLFCFNQGANIGLAYFFGLQDLIADNILAIGSHPLFFDMEMLLSPTPKAAGDYLTNSCVGQHYLKSVIRSGLIPCYGFETLNAIGYNNSGLSIVNSNKRHIPKFINKQFYHNELLDGFDYTCSFIANHREEIVRILKEEVVSNPHLQTRYLVRYTFNYSQLLKALRSPLCQGDALQRHLTIENLWRGYNKTILDESIIGEEIRQISQGDIPLFTTNPNSVHLYDERGKIIFRDYFQSNGITAAINKITNFSERDARIQKEIIKRALYIHGFIDYSDVLCDNLIKSESIYNVDLTSQIAIFLYSLPQVKDDRYFTYVDYVISKDDIWDQGLQHLDLFQGIAGVGVFFMAWYRFTHDNQAKIIVNNIFNESIEFLRNNKNVLLDSPVVKLGVMQFPTSLLYYYILGKKIMGDESPLLAEDDMDFILKYIEERYTDDRHIDYFSGSTGLVLILMEVFKFHPSTRIKRIIHMIGNYLLVTSVKITPDMISWKKKSFNLWGGFAHGNSSISYALFKLYSFLNEEKFYEAGLKALAYDQALFDPAGLYWKKTLSIPGEIHHSWGNGSSGIALSRHLISPYYKNSLMEDEVSTARYIIKREITEKTYTDHSIGSGLLGLLEIGKLLDKEFPVEDYLKSELLSLKLSECRCGGWKGNPVITGLYYGFAGIGYNLIKLQYIPELPSLLWI